MSKIIKGIAKGVKKIFKGVKKIFKKITSSTIGKVLLGAALIYVGGVAMGKWGADGWLSGIHGKLAPKVAETAVTEGIGGAGATAEATATAMEAGEFASSVVPAGSASSQAAVDTAISEAAGGQISAGLAETTALAEAPGVAKGAITPDAGAALNTGAVTDTGAVAADAGVVDAGNFAQSVVPTGTGNELAYGAIDQAASGSLINGQSQSLLSRIMGGLRGDPGVAGDGFLGRAGTFMKDNPIPTAMMFSGVASAFGNDEIDILKEQEKIRREKYRTNFEGTDQIDIGFRPAQNSSPRQRAVMQRFGGGVMNA